MGSTVTVSCPYCGESVDVEIEADLQGTMVQDCEVCCRPWRMTVSWEDGEVSVGVDRDS